MGMTIDVLISLFCWCGMFLSIALQANPIVTLVFCWISGCFAGLLFSKYKWRMKDGNDD